MSTLTDSSQDHLGWVYPLPPQSVVNTTEEVSGIMSGTSVLVEDQDYVDVVFGSAQPSNDWVLVGLAIFNTLDSTPLNVWPGVVTSKTVTGFRLQLNGVPDSTAYYLTWSVRGVFGYYLSGPESGALDIPSSVFTLRLPDDSTLSGTVVITLSDGGIGGTFVPSTVELTADDPSNTFVYTPSTYGSRTIVATNDRGLVNPAGVGFFVEAETYEMTGPSSGTVSVASTNFTVTLPEEASITGSVTITPSDGGSGGTFTPSSVELTTDDPSATFTYTPVVDGAITISATNDRDLADPDDLAYTASDPSFLDLFTGSGALSSHTSDTGDNWTGIDSMATAFLSLSGGSLSNANGAPDAMASATGDEDARITVVKGSVTGLPEVGIWLRGTPHLSNPRGYMGRFVQGSGYQFYRLDVGLTYVQLGSNTAGSLDDGDELKFTVSGTGATVTLTLYKNSVSVATIGDSAADRIVSNGRIGIHLFDPSSGSGNYKITKLFAP